MLEAGEHGELEPFSATACQSNTCTMHVVCRTRRVADCYWVNIAFVDEEKNDQSDFFQCDVCGAFTEQTLLIIQLPLYR